MWDGGARRRCSRGESSQIRAEVIGMLVSLCSILGEGLLEYELKVHWKTGAEGSDRRSSLVQYGIAKCLLKLPSERKSPVSISWRTTPDDHRWITLIRLFPAYLFGGHIGKGSGCSTFSRQACPAGQRATPKSRILTSPRLVMKILAGLMSRWTMPCSWASEALSDLDGDFDGFFDLQRPGLDLLLERLAFVVVHNDEQLTVGGLINVMDIADVIVLQG